ncbi:hypothetical protein GLAREA_06325 [Glarea lozoyensis ATCC 20868]|uniref:Uncharacterized protein n=1 Tax=Glarea lozoyensis (strain ATCC 20868 / MF5171) TaxID=1116229 RepID=S3E4J5_GLAL2|nr:uncharacterized protein GLAREA_06325 [Glarea lozoyensis ATCC 20868]EPE33313.1 hypothetical protein GLAREA_06325 [Glarea lozoyensis ATCC 20868]
MRAAEATWILTAGIILGYITGTSALSGGKSGDLEKSDMLDLDVSDEDGGMIAQKVIVTVLTSASILEVEEKQLEKDLGNEKPPHQEISIVTVTSESAVVITYPKITEAPSLFKRKIGSNRWDLIHEDIQGRKRDATQCPVDYQLCPDDVGGGCCPNDRVCGKESCLPTSAAPASACGKLGYTACALAEGGGCCPSDYVCGQAGCSPSAGVSYTQSCAASSYLCPASLNYGCCKSGMGCALNGCYTTSISTYTLLETVVTTDSNSKVQTVTNTRVTATTPVQPSGTASSDAGMIPKIASSAVAIAKVTATGTASPSTGLTKSQIGGIIGGSIAFLAIILIAATLILRRLNKVAQVAATRSQKSSSGPRSGPSRQRGPPPMAPRDVDAMSVDPLMMAPSEATSSVHGLSYRSSPWGSAHEVEANSPPMFNNSPFTPQTPAHSHYPRGYAPVSASEAGSANRNNSLDTTPPSSINPNRGYFDLPIQSNRDSQVSPRRPSHHGRNWSNASDQSGVSQISDPAELDGDQDTSRRSSLSRALYGLGMGRMISGRRRSDPNTNTLTGGPQKKGEYSSPASPALHHIPEAAESHDNVNYSQPPTTTRQRGLSGTQLREAGLSNSQLREMTMNDTNLYISPVPKPTPKDYDDVNGEGKSRIYG